MVQKPVIGLVGGIGAGKSAAAAAFARRGGVVIDADKLGHDVLDLPEVSGKLVARWGIEILKPDGTINRRAVAGIVFPDPDERRALEAIVYPHIGERVTAAIATARADPACRFVVLDAAVMLEAGWAEIADAIVYIDAPRPLRLERLANRSGWTAADLAAREAAQMPAAEKIARADVVIFNDGSIPQLQDRVDTWLATRGY